MFISYIRLKSNFPHSHCFSLYIPIARKDISKCFQLFFCFLPTGGAITRDLTLILEHTYSNSLRLSLVHLTAYLLFHLIHDNDTTRCIAECFPIFISDSILSYIHISYSSRTIAQGAGYLVSLSPEFYFTSLLILFQISLSL